MKDILLLKLGEIVLKGLNRKTFEQKLVGNVRRRLLGLGAFQVSCMQSTIYVEPQEDDIDMDAALEAMTRVFGVASVVRAAACEKSPEAIAEKAIEYMGPAMRAAASVILRVTKVSPRRSDSWLNRIPLQAKMP